MQRTPIPIIELEGTPIEIAFKLGKKRKSRIQARVEFWNRHVARLFQGKQDRRKLLERGFLKAAQAAPQYLEEIRAMAQGANVPFGDLFRLNLTELKTYVDKCTTLILPVKEGRKKRILLAHNEDWNPEQNDVFLLKARLPGLSYLIVAYDGYLPGLSCGLNSYGFYHAVNYLRPLDQRVGLPRIFITRHLVTARDFKDTLRWVRGNQRAFGQSIHMAQGDRYLNLELTAKKVVTRRPALPTLHANHYLSPALASLSPPPADSSKFRQEIGTRLIKEKKSAKEILSDRSGFPYAIWREADHPRDPGATLATAVMKTGKLEMTVYRHRPIEGRCRTVQLV